MKKLRVTENQLNEQIKSIVKKQLSESYGIHGDDNHWIVDKIQGLRDICNELDYKVGDKNVFLVIQDEWIGENIVEAFDRLKEVKDFLDKNFTDPSDTFREKDHVPSKFDKGTFSVNENKKKK